MTLNLLPPDKKAALRSGFVYAYVQAMLLIIFILVTFAAGTLWTVRLSLKNTFDDLSGRAGAGADESKKITDEIALINEYVARINGLDERFTPWSKVLEEIAALIPAGTQLETMRVDRAGNISFDGIARVRNDVLTIRDRLEQSKSFQDVRSPLSNILQQRNVRFNFEMRYVRPEGQ